MSTKIAVVKKIGIVTECYIKNGSSTALYTVFSWIELELRQVHTVF
jgi:hypothetical protein